MTRVAINAWTGREAATGEPVGRTEWALAGTVLPPVGRARPRPKNEWDWCDPRVGWGLVLPHRPGLTNAQLAVAVDAPTPIQRLVAARSGAKVLRYMPGTTWGSWTLRDYATGSQPPIATAPEGTDPGSLPAYLLIYAGPEEIPWEVQYHLNPVRNVGRLHLTGPALENYVNALLSDWRGSAARYDSPVVWAVDHGGGDITTIMRETLAEPLHAAFVADGEMGRATMLEGPAATARGLAATLDAASPLVVVTTSHGLTGPLDQPDLMRSTLGALVDAAHEPLDPAGLLSSWEPDGMIWLAQACCSAGAAAPSMYRGLFDPAEPVGEVIEAVAALGPMVAPLPTALLGAPRPARAFIGQVEPTFDWTLYFPLTGQWQSGSLRDAVYQNLCRGEPAGYALREVYQPIGSLLQSHSRSVGRYNGLPPGAASRQAVEVALYNKATAYDRASTVLLGDPTVAVPLP
ncbi:hypothetical protein [Nonomuraea sp. NPDC049709]|uniref:hypothetical protein n=1 Tax=Nonomuraea sp. NPDC049709 TaxID=3154736 RepID=UPI00344601DE